MIGVNMTVDNFSTIKADVLLLGDFTDSQKLDMQIQMIIDEVLQYCYRKDVPSEMELPLADVIVSEINKKNMFKGINGDVTSYREGDMSVSFGSETTSTGSSVKYGGKIEKFKLIIGVE